MKELDKRIREVATLLTNDGLAMLGGLQGLEEQVKKLSITFKQDLIDVIRSMYQAISAGVDPKGLNVFMETTGMCAMKGGATMDNITTVVTSLANLYGIDTAEIKKIKRITDILYVGMWEGKVTMDDLASSLEEVMFIAHSVSMTIEEMIAIVAALTTNNIRAVTATKYLRAVLYVLLDPEEVTSQIFEKLHLGWGILAMRNHTLQEWIMKIKNELDITTNVKMFKWAPVFRSQPAMYGAVALTPIVLEKYTEILNKMRSEQENN